MAPPVPHFAMLSQSHFTMDFSAQFIYSAHSALQFPLQSAHSSISQKHVLPGNASAVFSWLVNIPISVIPWQPVLSVPWCFYCDFKAKQSNLLTIYLQSSFITDLSEEIQDTHTSHCSKEQCCQSSSVCQCCCLPGNKGHSDLRQCKMPNMLQLFVISFMALALSVQPGRSLASHQAPPQLRQDHVFFRHVGTTVPTLSYIHVAFDLDLLSIANNLKTLQDAVHREQTFFQSFQLARRNWLAADAPPHLRRQEEKNHEMFHNMASNQWLTMFHHSNTIQKLIDDVDLILSLGEETKIPPLKHNPHPAFNDTILSRPRRFAFTTIALGFTALASTLFGLFTQGQIHNMQKEIKQLGEQSRTIINIQHQMLSVLENNTLHIAELQDSLNIMTADIRTITIMQQFEQKSVAIAAAITAAVEDVRAVEAIVEAMMSNKISLKLFKRQTLQAVLQAVTVKSAVFGYVPLLTHFSDFLQCEASFVYNERGFTIFMHTPAHIADTALTILEHVPFPIRVHQELFAEISTDYKYLGVHENSRHFAVFTADELQACNHRGTAFLCHNHNILTKYEDTTPGKEAATCLFALYRQDYATILKTCDTHIKPAADRVVQYNEHIFWTYTAQPHQGNIFCPDRKPRRFSADSTAEVTLPTGCTAETKAHMFTAGATLATSHWDYHWGWPKLALANLTQDIDLDGYAALLRTAHPRVRHRIPSEIAQIKTELTHLSTNSSYQWMASNENMLLKIGVGIVGTLAAFASLYIVISVLRKRCRRAMASQEGTARAAIQDSGVKVFLNTHPDPNPSAPAYPSINAATTPRHPF